MIDIATYALEPVIASAVDGNLVGVTEHRSRNEIAASLRSSQ